MHVCVCVCMCVCARALSHVWLFATLWTVARQAPLPKGFSWQAYWSGLPCPSPGDLPHPWIQPTFLASPALAGRFLTAEPPGKPMLKYYNPLKPIVSDGSLFLGIFKPKKKMVLVIYYYAKVPAIWNYLEIYFEFSVVNIIKSVILESDNKTSRLIKLYHFVLGCLANPHPFWS